MPEPDGPEPLHDRIAVDDDAPEWTCTYCGTTGNTGAACVHCGQPGAIVGRPPVPAPAPVTPPDGTAPS